MAWTRITTSFRTPTIPYYIIGENIWRGYDIWPANADRNLYLYTVDGSWVIGADFGAKYYIDDVYLVQSFSSVNENIYFWRDTGLYLWNDSTYGWVITESDTFLVEDGVNWWVASGGLLPVAGNSLTFTAQGIATGDKIVESKFVHWEHSAGTGTSPYGLYTDPDAIQPNKIVGSQGFKDQNNTEYIRSLEKADGEYTYSTIHYDATNSKWVIGTINESTTSTATWYEGSEPDKATPVTFTFEYHTPDPIPSGWEIPTNDDLVVAFNKYVAGSNFEDSFIFEAPIWL